MRLPPEILLLVVASSIANFKDEERHKLYGILLACRTTYGLVSERLYRTVVLRSSRMTNKFVDAVTSSNRLSEFLVNLWVAGDILEEFSYQLGSSPDAVMRILMHAPNLRRLALPSKYFPRFLNPRDMPSIAHLTVSEDVFPPSTPDLLGLNAIHVYGPLWPTRVEVIITRCPNLRYITCTIQNNSQTYVSPAAHCAETLLTGLPALVSVEFVSSKRFILSLRQYLSGELRHKEHISRISTRYLAIREESPCEQWVQECNKSS